jgi:periplasmic protein TonB
MYADRYQSSAGVRSGSMGVSILIAATMIGGLVFSAPKIITTRIDRLITTNIPLPPPPPPQLPKPQPQPKQAAAQTIQLSQPEHLTAPQPIITTVPQPTDLTGVDIPLTDGTGTGTIPVVTPSPAPLPLIPAATDPHYARDFQPAYPPEERRAGREGIVVVRVLIGVDGRVKDIETVSSVSSAFLDATLKQARAKWRFKPATRGDVPIESWKTMRVSFVLNDADS